MHPTPATVTLTKTKHAHALSKAFGIGWDEYFFCVLAHYTNNAITKNTKKKNVYWRKAGKEKGRKNENGWKRKKSRALMRIAHTDHFLFVSVFFFMSTHTRKHHTPRRHKWYHCALISAFLSSFFFCVYFRNCCWPPRLGRGRVGVFIFFVEGWQSIRSFSSFRAKGAWRKRGAGCTKVRGIVGKSG